MRNDYLVWFPSHFWIGKLVYQKLGTYLAHSIFYSSFMATYFIRQDSNKSYYLELILINNFLQTQIVIWFQKAFLFCELLPSGLFIFYTISSSDTDTLCLQYLNCFTFILPKYSVCRQIGTGWPWCIYVLSALLNSPLSNTWNDKIIVLLTLY